MRKNTLSQGSRKLIIAFWSIAFVAVAILLIVYKLGLTDFEPIISFGILIGLTAVLSIIFHQVGDKHVGDHRYDALRNIFGGVGILAILAGLAVTSILWFFLFMQQPSKVINIGVDLPL